MNRIKADLDQKMKQLRQTKEQTEIQQQFSELNEKVDELEQVLEKNLPNQ